MRIIDRTINNNGESIRLSKEKYYLDLKSLNIMKKWQILFRVTPAISALIVMFIRNYIFRDEFLKENVVVFILLLLLLFVIFGYVIEFIAFKKFRDYLRKT